MKTKLIKIILLAVFSALAFSPYGAAFAYAKEDTKDIEKQMEENVSELIDSLDTSEFDKFIYSLDGEEYKIFGSQSFKDKLKSMLRGEASDYGSIFGALLEITFSQALKMLPVLASICAVAILCNLLTLAKPNKAKSGEAVHFVCYLSIVLIVLNMIYQLVLSTVQALEAMNGLMSVVFPVILTLMTASGSTASGSIYQPAVALLCTSVANIFISIIVPLFVASIVLNVVGNFTDNIRVGKFAEFFKSTGKWIVGVTFTVFLAFLSIQGISASTYDSVSVRAVKYAISNSIPLVGGYIKEGFDLILGSTVLIKNAVGVTGLLLLLAYVAAPMVNMIVCSLGLKLAAAVCEPVSDAKIPSFLQSAAKSFSLLMAAFFSVSFMFFITVMLLLMTSNSVLV